MDFRSLIKARLNYSEAGALQGILKGVYRRYRRIRNERRFSDRAARDIFTDIYANGLWGRDPKVGAFYSGVGSHDEEIVGPYITASRQFLQEIGSPDVVDIGCGDFAVGARLRPYCRRYLAADIVEPLIFRNIERYAGMDVDFKVIDLAKDVLPVGDVLFVRQVFQHMSNADIVKALIAIASTYSYLVVSEHLPADQCFPHNLEKAAGPDIRLYLDRPSGVVLTSPPFDLVVRSTHILCDVPTFDGVSRGTIRTTAYRLA